jgi:hypothetical protein
MQHARVDYQRIQDPEGLIPEKEPVFLIRAQDNIGWMAVVCWCILAKLVGADKKIIKLAMRQALRMLDWPLKKTADVR